MTPAAELPTEYLVLVDGRDVHAASSLTEALIFIFACECLARLPSERVRVEPRASNNTEAGP